MNRSSITKHLFKAALCTLLFFQVEKFCHRRTAGFQISKVHSSLPSSAKWELPPLAQEEKDAIAQILSQPFTFIGSGGQCYAFQSQDKKVVLKLFKMHHLRQYPLARHLPLPGKLDEWRTRLLNLQEQKLERLFGSSRIAYETLKEETGLIHLQLNPLEESPFTTTLIDKIGIKHLLPLGNVPFVLQTYAENPFKKLRVHLRKNEMIEAKAIVKEIVDALTLRYQKGIMDLDPALRRNIGMTGNGAIFIDIGAFTKAAEEISSRQQLYAETRRMDRWLAKRSPELKAYLDALIE